MFQQQCDHTDQIKEVEPSALDSNRHATAHFQATEHPIIRSFEPGEDWRWSYVDEALV
jgi:hypothetical protein